MLAFCYFFSAFHFAFLCPHPHFRRFQFCFAFFSFSPLPHSPRRPQRPCLRDLVLPSPGCGRLSTACCRTRPSGSGGILVFSLQKAPGRAKAWSRGAYLNFWPGRPRQPASALQLLPEAAFWWPPADSALCRLPCPVVRVGAARGHPAPFPLTVREAVKSAAWVPRRRGPVEAALRTGFRAPPGGRGLRCPVGSQELAQSLRRRLWAPEQSLWRRLWALASPLAPSPDPADEAGGTFGS